MKRTTIMVDEQLLLELKHWAEKEDVPTSELIREALQDYLKSKTSKQKRQLSCIGAGKSGKTDVSLRAEEILTHDLEVERQ